MAGLSDSIEEFIKAMLENREYIELQRNELAQSFRCAPSQINYVLSTRFAPEHGYVITSRRGGGGYIKIVRVNYDNTAALRDIILSYLDGPISNNTAQAIVGHLLQEKVVSLKEARIIASATSDKSIPLPPPARDLVRTAILKNIILSLMTE